MVTKVKIKKKEIIQMINWSQIEFEAGLTNVENFYEGNLSGRDLSRLSPTASKVIRNIGVEKVRQRARYAIYRRNKV